MTDQILGFLNKKLSPPALKHQYNIQIEQYRGLCALLVFMYHGVSLGEYMLLDSYSLPSFVHYFGAGGLSVILFFCISGFAIGVSHDKASLNVGDYLKRRLLRLYPIYLVSFFICLIVAAELPLKEVLGNLFILQNNNPYLGFKIPIFVNVSTWSLNYEIVYYLLFIAFFFLQPKIWKILLFMLIVSVGLIYAHANVLFFADYVDGLYFWLLGLIIAWNIFKYQSPKNNAVPLLSLLFLQMSQDHLGLGEIILHTISIRSPTIVNFLFDLPFCLMVMCILTGRDNAFLRFNKLLSYALPACVFLYLVFAHRIFEDMRWIMCLIYYLLSLLFYFEKRISAFLMDKLTGVGKISYGVYLLHVPVALLIQKTAFMNDRYGGVVVKYALWIILTFGLSVLLERYLQPALKRWFFPVKA